MYLLLGWPFYTIQTLAFATATANSTVKYLEKDFKQILKIVLETKALILTL